MFPILQAILHVHDTFDQNLLRVQVTDLKNLESFIFYFFSL